MKTLKKMTCNRGLILLVTVALSSQSVLGKAVRPKINTKLSLYHELSTEGIRAHAKQLRKQARGGKKLDKEDWQAIHKGWQAEYNLARVELEGLHEEYDDTYTVEDVVEIVHRLEQKLESLSKRDKWDRNQTISNFKKEYPNHGAIENLIEKLKQQYDNELHYLDRIYSKVKYLNDGIPTMHYSPEFEGKISKVLGKTFLRDELWQYVEVGNLQEAVWQLDEAGWKKDAQELENILRRELEEGEFVFEQDTGLLLFKSGIRAIKKMPGSAKGELVSYQLDRMLGLNAFPITTSRTIDFTEYDAPIMQVSLQLIIPSHGRYEMRRGGSLYPEYMRFIGDNTCFLDCDRRRARTHALFSLDWDGVDTISPLRGRAIKVDGEYALVSADEHIKFLRSHPQLHYFAPDFIARLQNLTTEEIRDTIQPYAEEKTDKVVAAFQEVVAEYLQIAKELQ